MKQAGEKYKIREISYLFQTLEKEWERSGRTVTKRKLNQDALDMFSEYYVQKVKEYETEQDNIKTKLKASGALRSACFFSHYEIKPLMPVKIRKPLFLFNRSFDGLTYTTAA